MLDLTQGNKPQKRRGDSNLRKPSATRRNDMQTNPRRGIPGCLLRQKRSLARLLQSHRPFSYLSADDDKSKAAQSNVSRPCSGQITSGTILAATNADVSVIDLGEPLLKSPSRADRPLVRTPSRDALRRVLGSWRFCTADGGSAQEVDLGREEDPVDHEFEASKACGVQPADLLGASRDQNVEGQPCSGAERRCSDNLAPDECAETVESSSSVYHSETASNPPSPRSQPLLGSFKLQSAAAAQEAPREQRRPEPGQPHDTAAIPSRSRSVSHRASGLWCRSLHARKSIQGLLGMSGGSTDHPEDDLASSTHPLRRYHTQTTAHSGSIRRVRSLDFDFLAAGGPLEKPRSDVAISSRPSNDTAHHAEGTPDPSDLPSFEQPPLVIHKRPSRLNLFAKRTSRSATIRHDSATHKSHSLQHPDHLPTTKDPKAPGPSLPQSARKRSSLYAINSLLRRWTPTQQQQQQQRAPQQQSLPPDRPAPISKSPHTDDHHPHHSSTDAFGYAAAIADERSRLLREWDDDDDESNRSNKSKGAEKEPEKQQQQQQQRLPSTVRLVNPAHKEIDCDNAARLGGEIERDDAAILTPSTHADVDVRISTPSSSSSSPATSPADAGAGAGADADASPSPVCPPPPTRSLSAYRGMRVRFAGEPGTKTAGTAVEGEKVVEGSAAAVESTRAENAEAGKASTAQDWEEEVRTWMDAAEKVDGFGV